MTHEEIIAKLNFAEPSLGMDYVYYRALKDIVKIHMPFTPIFGGGFEYCHGCDTVYPCRTIETIERALL